jgi:hypothetical protein
LIANIPCILESNLATDNRRKSHARHENRIP